MRGVRGLSPQEVGLYTMLLCRMYEENGPIEDHPLKLATYCGMRQATFEKVLQKLVDLDKITRQGGMLFNDRAGAEISSRANDLKIASKAGKASAEKRQQKQRKPSTPVQRPFNHTDTDTDTDIIRDTYVSLALSAPEPASDLAEAVAIYNQAASEVGWPRCTTVNPKRSKSLKARLKECGGVKGWRFAIDKAKASDFVCGRSERAWAGFNFDSMVSQKNFTSLMEGKYDNRTNAPRDSDTDAAARQISFAAGARRSPSKDCF